MMRCWKPAAAESRKFLKEAADHPKAHGVFIDHLAQTLLPVLAEKEITCKDGALAAALLMEDFARLSDRKGPQERLLCRAFEISAEAPNGNKTYTVPRSGHFVSTGMDDVFEIVVRAEETFVREVHRRVTPEYDPLPLSRMLQRKQ